MNLTPEAAGLLGTAVGAAVGIVGNVVAAQSALQRERQSFVRGASVQHLDRVRSAYESALNLLFETTHGGPPDRDRYGVLVARISLFGSSEVQDCLNASLRPQANRHQDFERLVHAMKVHLAELESLQLRE